MQKLLMDCHARTRVSVWAVRITILILTLSYHQSFSISFQNCNDVIIAVDLKNASIPEALQTIGTKSGYGITYKDSEVSHPQKITYQNKHVSVAEAINHVLRETNLTFKEYKSNIVIVVKPVPKANTKGSIEGKISDKESGEPLIGASIRLIGTSLGNISDVNGLFVVTDVPEGTYQLAVSYLGYETLILRDIKVIGGQKTSVDQTLVPSGIKLQDVEIIGDRVLSGNVVETNETALLKEIKNSSLIITGISAQQIARSVDQDAGEVARRLPGVSLQNNFVNIRGMHERYNITYLNGMVAPSSEADRRAFSYDLLPSNMIDKMTVYRSPGPELLGDWAGGAIKIETKNTSIARQFEVNLSTWYRPGSSFENYNTNAGGKKDWLGKDDGTRALPSDFPDMGAIPAGGIGSLAYERTDTTGFKGAILTPENLAENARLSRSVYNSWDVKNKKSGLDYRAGFNYYDAWKIGKVRLSNLTSINTTQTLQIITQDFAPQRLKDNKGAVSATRAFTDTISRKSARWGILQNLAIILNPRHTFELKGIYNRLGTDETLIREGNEALVIDNDGYVRNILYTYRSRSIGVGQIAGTNSFGAKGDHQFKWSVGYSGSVEDVPAQRGFYSPNPPYDNVVPSRASVINSLYYINSNEKNLTYMLDYEKKFQNGMSLKVGGFFENKSKEMDTRMIKIKPGIMPINVVEGDSINEHNYGKIFGPKYFPDDGSGGYIFDTEYLSGQYKIGGRISSGYVAFNLPAFNKKLNIYGGVRYEGQNLLLTLKPSRSLEVLGYNTTLIDRYLDHWLPSVNLTWNFTKKLLARAAYGKTINRPNYREFIPTAILDPRLDNLTIGSDSLIDATIQNFDVRFEYYPSDGEFISAGVFYKDLRNAIEPYATPDGQKERIHFDNTDKATVYGIEFELRKSLTFTASKFLRKFSIIANAAWLHSEVKFSDGLIPDNNGDFLRDNQKKVRPLEGTAKYVLNGGLYFEHDDWGTKISLLYNVIGQRLVYAPSYVWPGTYELPRHVIDLTIRQKVNKFIELRFAVQDLLNQPRRLYRDYDRDQKFDPNKRNKLPYRDWMFQQYKPGSYYMIGVNLTL